MKIVVVSAHAGSLIWFRLDMMKDFMSVGHEVVAVGPESAPEVACALSDVGIRYEVIPVERNGINPLNDLKYLSALRKFMKRERPDRVFLYQAKPVVYGALAARSAAVREVYSLIAGLGSIFRGRSAKARIVRAVMTAEFWVAGRCSKIMFFQNRDDRREFVGRGLISEAKTKILSGSGVNLERFQSSPLPREPALLFIGRLIKDKGVREYLEACEVIKKKCSTVRCMLVGPFDSNPTAMTPAELARFVDSGVVEYFGEQSDVHPFLDQCSIYVLPSYHEGTPKTVLEAMATGRPIITTDAPGCRETVEDGVNGYLVPPQDTSALVDAIESVLASPTLGQRMGSESRRIAESRYDVRMVNCEIMATMGILPALVEES